MDSQQLQNILNKIFGISEQNFEKIIKDLKNGRDELFEQWYITPLEGFVNYLEEEHKVGYVKAYSCNINTFLKIKDQMILGQVGYRKLIDTIAELVEKNLSAKSKTTPKNKDKNSADALLKNKNFGLTQQEFNDSVFALRNGDNTLFGRIYLKHFEKCMKFLINYRSANEEDAYTSTMDALLEIRKDLLKGKIKYGNLAYFFTFRACKKLYKIRNRGNAQMKMETIKEHGLTDNYDLIKELQTREMKSLVKKALNKLDEKCKRKLILYYYEGLTWEEIADLLHPGLNKDELKTKANTLRRDTSRRCLPAFSSHLKKLLGEI